MAGTPTAVPGGKQPPKPLSPAVIGRDLLAGTVVFLVALPLCLGIAVASSAQGYPLNPVTGMISGIVGGLLVGLISGSSTSVSGPAASLTAIVSAQLVAFRGLEGLLIATILAGVLQVVMGALRLGFIAAFFPTSVIKGLLAAIGVILILKQLPHLFGDDNDPQGDFSFWQPDSYNTFTEFGQIMDSFHLGASLIGLISLAILYAFAKVPKLKQSPIPPALVVVFVGVLLAEVFQRVGGVLVIGPKHLINVPIADSFAGLLDLSARPTWETFRRLSGEPDLYLGALTIALVASIASLLNLEAVDNIDPKQRNSPPSRELVAQGCGNIAAGFLGGLPITSVIIRSSVNVNTNNETKLSAVWHGFLLVGAVAFFPEQINRIPMSCLAGILIVAGIKLASPAVFRTMYAGGWAQFVPFVVTVAAIVRIDILWGIAIGLCVAIVFILRGNMQRPLTRVREKHIGGEVLHVVLANQVSFLNRAAILQALDNIPRGGSVLLDATNTDYIDPDVRELLREFRDKTAPARKIKVSTVGFHNIRDVGIEDEIQFVDYSTRELQDQLTPGQVLAMLEDGHRRFQTGRRLHRDHKEQLSAASAQHPLAVVLSCIDSRAPVEIIFDLGLGDVFVARVAGNVVSPQIIGSVEYACGVAGAKLVLVMGHTKCGAVTAALQFAGEGQSAKDATGLDNVESILSEIEEASGGRTVSATDPDQAVIDDVARQNVLRTVAELPKRSAALAKLIDEGRIEIVGAMYDVQKGQVTFLSEDGDRTIAADDDEPANGDAGVLPA